MKLFILLFFIHLSNISAQSSIYLDNLKKLFDEFGGYNNQYAVITLDNKDLSDLGDLPGKDEKQKFEKKYMFFVSKDRLHSEQQFINIIDSPRNREFFMGLKEISLYSYYIPCYSCRRGLRRVFQDSPPVKSLGYYTKWSETHDEEAYNTLNLFVDDGWEVHRVCGDRVSPIPSPFSTKERLDRLKAVTRNSCPTFQESLRDCVINTTGGSSENVSRLIDNSIVGRYTNSDKWTSITSQGDMEVFGDIYKTCAGISAGLPIGKKLIKVAPKRPASPPAKDAAAGSEESRKKSDLKPEPKADEKRE